MLCTCVLTENDSGLELCIICAFIFQVLTVPVDHCPQAYGLVLTHIQGWKIVYSGDTRPCLALIKAGKSFARVVKGTRDEELPRLPVSLVGAVSYSFGSKPP